MTKHFSRLWAWMFPFPSARELIEEQISEAQREHLLHAAAAEHNHAVAEMYRERVVRLESILANSQKKAPHVD